MDVILGNFKDPNWWFSGVFFLFIPWVLAKASEKFIKPLRKLTTKFFKIRRLKDIKKGRWDPLVIQQQIARTNSHFIIFALLMAIFFYLLLLSPSKPAAMPLPSILILSAPIYIFESMWLLNLSKTKSMINSRRKILRGFKNP